MTEKRYLTDEQWQLIAPYFSNQRRYKWEKRELIYTVLYVNGECYPMTFRHIPPFGAFIVELTKQVFGMRYYKP